MSIVLAEGVVEVEVDGSGVPKKIRDDIDRNAGPINQSGTKLAGRLLGGLVVGAGVAAAGVITAFGTKAISGGMSRLLAIEDAEAKLLGLGHSTETVAGIMTNALDSVRGTAFGLGDAAGIAAGAVAAGIQPGQELERVLRLTADAATIAGTDLGSMGSIFNKVAASGRLQGDVIAQLQDAGVPILQFVAQEMGVTAEEARKLASEGAVSFETFANAMESGLGGAALESGNTTRGAFANMEAAVSRVGANFLGGVFPVFKEFFGGIQDALGPLEEDAGSLGAEMATVLAPAIMGVVDVVRDSVRWFVDNREVIGNITQILGIAAAAWFVLTGATAAYNGVMKITAAVTKAGSVAQWALNVAMKANPIGIVITLISLLVGAIIWVATQTTFFQDAWAVMSTAVGNAFTWLWENAIKPVVDAVVGAFTWLYDNVLAPIFTGVMIYVGLWAAIFEWLWNTAISPVVNAIGAGFRWLQTNVIAPVSKVIGNIIRGVGDVFRWLWQNGVKPQIDAVGNAFRWLQTNIIQPVSTAISTALRAVGSTVASVFGGIAGFIRGAFQAALGAVRGPVNGIIGLVNSVIDRLNGISVKIPDWVPVVGGQMFGLTLPRVPLLATGSNDAPDAFIAGEQGPELITGARGATVRPYSATRDMMRDNMGQKVEVKLEQKFYSSDPELAGRQAARGITRYLGVR